ncbi:MAG TPA: DMT family transporter [Solirubrobacteraceae bacterium]
MKMPNRSALAALALAGALWGLTVPLSKLALTWMGPSWLAVARFAAAAPVLAVVGRRGLRDALRLRVAATGAVGFGAVIVLQNIGIEHTSVSHAALVVGAVPVLVTLIGAGLGGAIGRPLAWTGYLLALVGIGLTAGGGGSGATMSGDLLVLVSAVLSAAVIVVQPRLLAGRDPAAVTAVQFAAGSLFALPVAVLTQGAPHTSGSASATVAFGLLALVGTLLPFWLFAFGQSRVPASLAGAFVNLEPVVGAAIGWLAFGNTAALTQIMGAIAVLGGIALSAGSSGSGAEQRRTNAAPLRPWRPSARLRPDLRSTAQHRTAAPCPQLGEHTAATASSARRFLRSVPGPGRGRLRRRAAPVVDGVDPRADLARRESPPLASRRSPGSDPRSPLSF